MCTQCHARARLLVAASSYVICVVEFVMRWPFSVSMPVLRRACVSFVKVLSFCYSTSAHATWLDAPSIGIRNPLLQSSGSRFLFTFGSSLSFSLSLTHTLTHSLTQFLTHTHTQSRGFRPPSLALLTIQLPRPRQFILSTPPPLFPAVLADCCTSPRLHLLVPPAVV